MRRQRTGPRFIVFTTAVVVTAAIAATLAASASAWDGDMALQRPSPDATLSAGSAINFSWAASPYGDAPKSLPYQLHFQIASEPGFGTDALLVNRTSGCYSPAGCPSSSTEGPFPPGTYYWRVTSSYDACLSELASRGMLESGAALSCQPQTSEIRSFTVAAPAPAPPPQPQPTPTPQPNPTPQPQPTPTPQPKPTPQPQPTPTPQPQPTQTPQPNPTPQPQPAPGSKFAKVWAFKSTGRVGSVAHLRVATEVGAPYSRYVVKVIGKRGVVATVKAPVLRRGLVQIVSWRVPENVKPGSLRFSVQALGATKSAKAYAQLVVKKQA
jgi:hypothetical protein